MIFHALKGEMKVSSPVAILAIIVLIGLCKLVF